MNGKTLGYARSIAYYYKIVKIIQIRTYSL